MANSPTPREIITSTEPPTSSQKLKFYNPPGRDEEGYLFWLSWANHAGATVFATQDAHGPIRHGIVVFNCNTATLLETVADTNPVLGTLVELLNGPTSDEICPQQGAPTP